MATADPTARLGTIRRNPAQWAADNYVHLATGAAALWFGTAGAGRQT